MYRERDKKELEDMKKSLIKGTIAECIYGEGYACQPHCFKFEECWKYDYSKLEKKVK